MPRKDSAKDRIVVAYNHEAWSYSARNLRKEFCLLLKTTTPPNAGCLKSQAALFICEFELDYLYKTPGDAKQALKPPALLENRIAPIFRPFCLTFTFHRGDRGDPDSGFGSI